MNVLKPFGIAVVTATLVSCASTGDVPSVKKMLKETTGQNGRACIRKTDIQSYGVLKHDIVSIDGWKKYYLATVLPGCTDLQTSMRAVFSSSFFEVCGGKMDRMVTRENHCTLGQIFEFENRDEAFATYHAILEKREQMKDAGS